MSIWVAVAIYAVMVISLTCYTIDAKIQRKRLKEERRNLENTIQAYRVLHTNMRKSLAEMESIWGRNDGP